MPSFPTATRVAAVTILLAIAGCVPGGSGTATPAATPEVAAPLPPIPSVTGPVALRVQYPSANAVVGARDSTFIFGTLGTGEATLTIDGAPVEVKPNGAFLA